MGIFQRKRRNRSFEDSNRRFLAKTSGVTPDWLTSLIQGSLAANYDEYEAGAGISTSDAFQAQYNYKTMLEQMEFNRLMQEDAQAFNAEMQEDAQAFNSAEAEKQRFWEEQMYNQYQSPKQDSNQLVHTVWPLLVETDIDYTFLPPKQWPDSMNKLV